MIGKADIKQLIREVVQEVQWDRQTPEGRAKEDARVDKVFKDTISGLQKQIAAGKQKDKAGKILNKKPFKKPFEEGGVNEDTHHQYTPQYPFMVRTHFEGHEYVKYVDTEKAAIHELQMSGNVGTILEIKREVKYPGQNQPIKKQGTSGGEGSSHKSFLSTMKKVYGPTGRRGDPG